MTGKAAGVNPQNFKIIDGKLYLAWSAKGADNFEAKAEENIRKADESWEKLTSQ